jgi:hypothetical protein
MMCGGIISTHVLSAQETTRRWNPRGVGETGNGRREEDLPTPAWPVRTRCASAVRHGIELAIGNINEVTRRSLPLAMSGRALHRERWKEKAP